MGWNQVTCIVEFRFKQQKLWKIYVLYLAQNLLCLQRSSEGMACWKHNNQTRRKKFQKEGRWWSKRCFAGFALLCVRKLHVLERFGWPNLSNFELLRIAIFIGSLELLGVIATSEGQVLDWLGPSDRSLQPSLMFVYHQRPFSILTTYFRLQKMMLEVGNSNIFAIQRSILQRTKPAKQVLQFSLPRTTKK